MRRRTRRELHRNVVAACLLLGLAGLYFLGATGIRASSLIGKGIGATAIPNGLAVALAAFALLLLVESLFALRGIPAEPARLDREERRAHLRAGGMLAIGVGFVAALEYLGYVPSLVLLLIVTATYNGRTLSRELVGFALLMSGVFYVLFVRVLGIPLPAGVWPGIWRQVAG